MRLEQELLPIGHADLVENVRHVMPDRTVTNRYLVGDLFVREPLFHQTDNLPFPLGQGFRSRQRRRGRVSLLLEG